MSGTTRLLKIKNGNSGAKKSRPANLAVGNSYSRSERSSAIGASAVNKKTFSLGSAVQTKVTIGQAGDRYEREADSVADKVAGGRDAGDISRIPSGGLKAQTQLVQREAEEGEGQAQLENEDAQEKCASCDGEDNAQKQSEEEPVETAQRQESEPEGEAQEKCATCETEDSVQKKGDESDDGMQALQRKEEQPESVTPASAQTQIVQREAEEGEDGESDEEADEGPIGGEDDPDAPDCGGGGEESVTEESGDAEETGESEAESAESGETGSESESADSAAGGEEAGCGEEGGEEEAEPEGGPTADAHAEQSCGGGEEESAGEESEGESAELDTGSGEGEASAPPLNPESAPGCADEVAEHEDTAAETAPEGEAEEESPAASEGGECAQTKMEEDTAQAESEDDSAQETAVQREDEETAQENGEEEAQLDGEGGAGDCAPAEAEAEAQMKTGPGQPNPANKSEIAAQAIRNRDSGEPLMPSVREKLEQSLRMDLSSVRVHTGAKAQQANKGLRAKAFTHKNHIWLGVGHSQSDLKLMAHEVTHTVQQGAVTRPKSGHTPNREEEQLEQGSTDGSAMTQMETDQSDGSVQASPMPTQRQTEFEWDDQYAQRLMDIMVLVDQIRSDETDNLKKKEATRQIDAMVDSMWRDFKAYVDSQGRIAGLTDAEKTFLGEEEKNIAEAEKNLTPENKVAEKDKENNALRRKALQSMGKLIKDPYVVYWMFFAGSGFSWKTYGDESIPFETESMSNEIARASSAVGFIKSEIRGKIYSFIAGKFGMDVEKLWEMIQPEDDQKDDDSDGDGDGSGGDGEKGEKPENLEGEFSEDRIRKLTKEQKKMLKRLPKSIQKSKDQDALVNLLDHLLTLPKDEQDALIKEMHKKEKQRAESDKKTGDDDKDKDQDKKPRDPKIDVDELKQEQKVKKDAEEILKDKVKDDAQLEAEKSELAEFLKNLSEQERQAFLEFLESVKSDSQHADKKSAKEIYDAYKQLSETDKEALKVKKLLNEQEDGAENIDPKAVRAMVKQQQDEAAQTRATAEKMNEDMAFIAGLVSDPDARKALVPFDPEDFRIMPEMMMLYGIMDGAGRMSPELREAADGLKNQIGKIRGKLLDEIKSIAIELGVHVALGAVPLVGWLKTAASAARLIKLGVRLNDLRKTLTALKRGYDTFNRVRSAIEQARSIVNSAPGFVKKFEQARKNWEALQSQLENLDADENIEERLELALDQLMEQMDERLESLEPFLEKLYLPEEVRDDPGALVKVLFSIPKGIDSFGDMLGSYEKFGDTSDPRELELLYYKGAQTGILLYPLVGFVIGELSEALQNWLEKERGLDDFLKKRKTWRSKGGSNKSATGRKFSSLWSRKLEYKGHSKGHTPQFEAPLKRGAEYLDKEIPKTNVPWRYRIKAFLRLKLRQVIKHLNKLNIKVEGRRKPKRKQTPDPWGPVPLPPFKYKLSRSGKYHNIILKINPEYERKVEVLDYTVFKDKGITLPDFQTDEGKALKKWLDSNGYELTDLPKIGWHIRRKKRNAVTKEPLRIKDGHIVQGLESKDSAALDRFVSADVPIGDNVQLPDGFHLQALGLSGTRKDSERYTVKKHPNTSPAYQLHLNQAAKLAKGPASGKQAVVLDNTAPADPVPDALNRPHKVTNQQLGYTVNRPRGSLPKVPDMKKRDDKGHLIAHRFNGSNNLANLVAMNRKLNQKGAWYKQEAALANAFKRAWQVAAVTGQKVSAFLSITVNYLSTNKTRRPNSFDMNWEVKKDGKKYESDSISNQENK